MIRESGEALLKILNGILEISKADDATLKAEDFDLAALVRTACVADGDAAAAKGLSFDIAVAAESQGRWRGDAKRLARVLGNLTSNAVKFTKAGGVTIAVDHQDATVRVRVADTGVGIPAKWVEEVFEAFSQVDASATRATGGTGVGLSIARELATLMGARSPWPARRAGARSSPLRFRWKSGRPPRRPPSSYPTSNPMPTPCPCASWPPRTIRPTN
uniref:histidine kinase n=1 Tax=Phenylobacterium glaciei TaxID=2803784 RepID=A0A974P0T1_9CAUL|nr:HAMP domain-containing histidine kinase [Phenylobacterium glaciei]